MKNYSNKSNHTYTATRKSQLIIRYLPVYFLYSADLFHSISRFIFMVYLERYFLTVKTLENNHKSNYKNNLVTKLQYLKKFFSSYSAQCSTALIKTKKSTARSPNPDSCRILMFVYFFYSTYCMCIYCMTDLDYKHRKVWNVKVRINRFYA